MYTLEDIERIIKPENLIACRGEEKNIFDMYIVGANYYIDPKSQDIYRLTKQEQKSFRVLEKINNTDTKLLNSLKNNPNQKLFHKKASNDKEIWFFKVSTEEKNQSFIEKHKAIESECKKDDFVEHCNNKNESLQRQKKKKKQHKTI